jgi:hypothetical protein
MKNLTNKSKRLCKKRLAGENKENKIFNLIVERIPISINQPYKSRKLKKINTIVKETINEIEENQYTFINDLLQTNPLAFKVRIGSENEKKNSNNSNDFKDRISQDMDEMSCLCSTNETISNISEENLSIFNKNFLTKDKFTQLELDSTTSSTRKIKIKILNEETFLDTERMNEKNNQGQVQKLSNLIPVIGKLKNETYKTNFNFLQLNHTYYENEYIFENFENLVKEEIHHRPTYGYMKNQTEINNNMRAILVDWLIDVHFKFQFKEETLHLTINFIDRYLSEKIVNKEKFQLLGVVCLFIASKYEEVFRQEIGDFIYITDYAYSIRELLEMEREVLQVLNYSLTITTSQKILEFAKIIYDLNEVEYNLAKYFLEIFCIDYRMINYSQTVVAFSCLYLVNKLYRKQDKYFEYCNIKMNQNDLKNCSKEIMFLYENLFTSSLNSTKNKFSKLEFSQVSKLKLVNH